MTTLISLIGLLFIILAAAPEIAEQTQQYSQTPSSVTEPASKGSAGSTGSARSALAGLEELPVKGRAAKTGYSRDEFGSGWSIVNGCDTRTIILHRDLENAVLDDQCAVQSGLLHDPYTGKDIEYQKGTANIQIDHVVALSDAWQKGAQLLSKEQRARLANDPLELLAVDGDANQQKSDADAATWLPSNKSFRCEYIARQVTIKKKYTLWITEAEKNVMKTVLQTCPEQKLL